EVAHWFSKTAHAERFFSRKLLKAQEDLGENRSRERFSVPPASNSLIYRKARRHAAEGWRNEIKSTQAIETIRLREISKCGDRPGVTCRSGHLATHSAETPDRCCARVL